MIKLEIKRADGTIYWTEHFDTRAQGEKWLAEERTRKYWVPTYTATFTGTDRVIQPIPEADKLKFEKIAADKAALKLLKKGDITALNMEDTILKIISLL